MILKIVESDLPDQGETLWISDVDKVAAIGVYVADPGDPELRFVKLDEPTGRIVDAVWFTADNVRWTCGDRPLPTGVAYRLTMRGGATEIGLFDAAAAYLMTDGGDTIDRIRSKAPVMVGTEAAVPTIAPLTGATSSGASTVTYYGTTWDVVN